ncbi:MAG: archaellin/type IV pilin N-terminal domain-containing protein [Thermoprotei archaeon]
MPKTLKKRAISPIIAALILILITVAAGVIVYIWATGYIGTQIGGLSGQENFVITKAKYYVVSSTNYLDVTILNQGSSAINVTSVKVYYANYTKVKATNTTSFPTIVINPGATSTLKVPLNNPLAKGTDYVVEVTTVKNNTAILRFTA